jgi:hypothetical protein
VKLGLVVILVGAVGCSTTETVRSAPSVISVPVQSSPLPVAIVSLAGSAHPLDVSEAIGALREAAREHTDLEVVSADDVLRTCSGYLACAVRALRAPGALNSTRAPDLFMRVQYGPAPGGGDRMTASLIDLQQAEPLVAGGGDQLELQGAVLAKAEVAAIRVDVRSATAAARAVGGLLGGAFKAAIEARGHWEPFKQIAFQSNVDGCWLDLDGESLGAVSAHVSVHRLSRAPHHLALTHSGYERLELRVPPDTMLVAADLVPERDPALFWSGVAAFVGGTAVVAAAIASPPVHDCVKLRPDGVCPPQGGPFATIPTKSALGPQDKNGLAVAPVGYSIAAAGLAWMATAEFWRDAPTWVRWLGGAAVGALAYGVSLVARR